MTAHRPAIQPKLTGILRRDYPRMYSVSIALIFATPNGLAIVEPTSFRKPVLHG